MSHRSSARSNGSARNAQYHPFRLASRNFMTTSIWDTDHPLPQSPNPSNFSAAPRITVTAGIRATPCEMSAIQAQQHAALGRHLRTEPHTVDATRIEPDSFQTARRACLK